MFAPFDLAAEQPKQMTGREERKLLQQAAARRATPAIRIKLAQLHNRLDEFGDTIALLGEGGPPDNYATARALAAAYLGRRQAGDSAAALAAARHAEALAADDIARAGALVDQAQAWLGKGCKAEAAEALIAALDCDPANFEAFRSLCASWLDSNEPDRVLTKCDVVAAKGVAHAQLLGTRTLALAKRGDPDAARALAGFDQFLFQTVPPAPEGWPDLHVFHAALAQELRDTPGVRNGRHGTASIASLRVDEPARAATPAMRALQQLIIAHVRKAVEPLPLEGHLWLSQRPAAAMLRMWCVMTGSEGFERWHMHPEGWASGGYYVAVPESVEGGNSTAGCFEFGMPGKFAGDAAAEAFGTRQVRPQAGLLTLFPSHAYHRTHPHGAEGQRICVAFDLVPL